MATEQTVLTLTLNPSVDVSCAVPQVIAEDKLRCTAPVYEPGGGGINVSRALARLGTGSRALYPSGGAMGRLLAELLDGEADEHEATMEHEPLPSQGATRESITVLEQSTNRQFRFTMPGPRMEGEDLRRIVAALARGSWQLLVLSGSMPPGTPEDLFAELAALARERGARLVIDTSGPALAVAVRAGAYLLKPNVGELAALVGAGHLDEAALEQAAAELVGPGGCEVLVVSLGAAGVLLVTADGLVERIAAPMVPVRSRVGAGDSTVAGIVAGLSRGLPVPEAVRYGVAAGSAAVMTPGTELCRRDDADRLYARMSGELSQGDVSSGAGG